MAEFPQITVLEEDADLVVVSKPPDLLTHPTPIFPEPTDAWRQVRALFGEGVSPLHRLDRKTSGVLLFARNPEAAARWAQVWDTGVMRKTYWAIVRGYAAPWSLIDRPLKQAERGNVQTAVTEVWGRALTAQPFAVGKFSSARYSLVELCPRTGRQHQLRRHLKGMNHPLIGDTVYGDGRQNAAFREHFGIHRMFLHASRIDFAGTAEMPPRSFVAPIEAEFADVCARFAWPLNRLPEAAQ